MADVTALCSLSDVQDIASDMGVALRVDDKPLVYANMILRASDRIAFYLLRYYSLAQIQSSRWARWVAAVFALLEVCCRRGNAAPPGVVALYKEALAELKMIDGVNYRLPGAAPRGFSGPRLSNYRVRLDPHPHSVVSQNRSLPDPPGFSRTGADELEFWGPLD